MYSIPGTAILELHRQAVEAQQAGHREVCGVMIGRDRTVVSIEFIENICEQPYRHEMRLSDVEEIEKGLLGTGLLVLGTFHSHPVSDAEPSEGDIAHGFYRGVELIYDVCG